MQVSIRPKSLKHISSGPVLQQTFYWAKVKENQGFLALAFDLSITGIEYNNSEKKRKSEVISEDILVIIREIGAEISMAYIPYGPAFDPGEEKRGMFLEELSESLLRFLPSGCIFIRYDLLWKSVWIEDENRYNEKGKWMGPPKPVIRELRMNFDTINKNLRKSSTDLLPSHTLFLDLKKDDEKLLKQMKSKTRYNIRLALRKGIKVHELFAGDLDIWYDLYKQTASRNGIVLHDPGYFNTVLRTKIPDSQSVTSTRLLVAEADGIPLAAMFLAVSGNRATYLYGASASSHREMMGTYALQWKAISKAREADCTEYDFFGISGTPDPAHPMYGLYRFKTGFGGYKYHRQGCWDYPFDTKEYEIYRSVEMSSQGYHLN